MKKLRTCAWAIACAMAVAVACQAQVSSAPSAVPRPAGSATRLVPNLRFNTPPQDELAIWQGVLDFGDPGVSRSNLLMEFQAILTNYPASQYVERAGQTAAILNRMIAEDSAHAKAAPTNLDRLPVEDRVRELIFQLREQNGRQMGQPGMCDIFMDPRGSNSAADQLVRIGYPAVPQLIVALDDQTFTRSVGYWRDFTFSHTVLTVGDCAVAILQRIAGRTFFVRNYTSAYMSKDNENEATRKEVEAWWSEFQKKDEKQMLIEGTEAGDNSAPQQAQLLIYRYPQEALAPMIKGIRNSTNDGTRARLVPLFAKFDSPEALAFLDQEIKEGADSANVAAATVLNRKGRKEGVAAMIEQWEKNPSVGTNIQLWPSDLVRFLAAADSPEAIDALGKNLQACSLNTRMTVVETVANGGLWEYLPVEGGAWESRYVEGTNRSAATMEAVEKFLVNALQDTGEIMGSTRLRGGIGYRNARICDQAGDFLNERWPDRYHFDVGATVEVRDAQRIECQNAWKKAHNP